MKDRSNFWDVVLDEGPVFALWLFVVAFVIAVAWCIVEAYIMHVASGFTPRPHRGWVSIGALVTTVTIAVSLGIAIRRALKAK